jgi:hypothetical protein
VGKKQKGSLRHFPAGEVIFSLLWERKKGWLSQNAHRRLTVVCVTGEILPTEIWIIGRLGRSDEE